MILGCLDGEQVQKVAAKCQTRTNTAIKWRDRFQAQGLAGLADETRPGAHSSEPYHGRSEFYKMDGVTNPVYLDNFVFNP
jgi:hypothetical protein